MTFLEYQQKAATTAIYLNKLRERFPNLPKEIYNTIGLAYTALGLGETGEVQDKIKKIIRDSAGHLDFEKKEGILEELGDVLWYVSQACTELGVTLDSVAEKNLKKLESRKDRGVLRGSGDNR